MSLPEEIMQELNALPEEKRREVLDFARFLRIRDELDTDRLMDRIIDDNLEAFKELAK